MNDAGTMNPPQYHLSDNVKVCFATPTLGAATLTDLTPDGNSSVIYQSGGDAGSTCPVSGVVAPPTGQECIRLDFTPVEGGTSGTPTTAQTCWLDVP